MCLLQVGVMFCLTHCALVFTHHAIAGGLDLLPIAWAANLQSHLWDCHSSAMHPAGDLTCATHLRSQQGCIVYPGSAHANSEFYRNTSLILLQASKALLSSPGFPSAAPPPLHCQVAKANLVSPGWLQTTALRLKQSMPEICSQRHYISGLIPPALHMLAKGKSCIVRSNDLICLWLNCQPCYP